VASGVLTSIGALFFAARLGTVGGDIGVGLEVIVLTATVLGGITLGGGKGSVVKSLVGVLVVLLITNGLTAMNARGGVNRMALATILLTAAMIDIRWQKNRTRIISKVYVAPTYHALPPPPPTEIGGGGPFEQNDKLRDVSLIGLGRIEAPEDVILDRNDVLYAGSRHGDIIRFFPPDYERMEVFAHIGGQPLGMAFDRQDNLYVCIGGMGLYRVNPDGAVEKATDETNRSVYSVNDDSRLRLADDLDITDDGLIFFSEATVRYEMDEWPVESDPAAQRERELLRVRSRDVLEHIERVLGHVRRLESSAESAVQMHFSAQSNRTNDIMRTLTVLTAVFMPLNLITGFFGMNFDFLPFVHTSAGVWLTTVVMAVVAIGLLIYFRRKRYFARGA